MDAPGTLKFADLYGSRPPAYNGQPQERSSVEASSPALASLDTARPAMFWAVLFLMLVFIRLLWEHGGK